MMRTQSVNISESELNSNPLNSEKNKSQNEVKKLISEKNKEEGYKSLKR